VLGPAGLLQQPPGSVAAQQSTLGPAPSAVGVTLLRWEVLMQVENGWAAAFLGLQAPFCWQAEWLEAEWLGVQHACWGCALLPCLVRPLAHALLHLVLPLRTVVALFQGGRALSCAPAPALRQLLLLLLGCLLLQPRTQPLHLQEPLAPHCRLAACWGVLADCCAGPLDGANHTAKPAQKPVPAQ
jgi:hypothetical protein